MSLSLFLRYVSLNVFGTLALSCYILADTWFVSLAEGSSGLAALNLSIVVFSIISGVGQMAGIGGATDFSIRKNRGEINMPSFTHALLFGGITGLFFLFLGLFGAKPVSLLLGADETTLPLTQTYVQTILCFAPAFILNSIVQSFVRNDDAPKLAMAGMLVSSLANIALDYVFMFPLGLGMFGAALATGISACLSLLTVCLHFRSSACTLRLCRIHSVLAHLPRMLSYGLSALIGELASAISLFTFNLILMDMAGYIGVAAYGIIANVALVGTSIFTGVGQGIQPLASQAYGQQDISSLRKLLFYTLIASFSLGALLCAGICFLASPIAAAFNHENNAALASIAVHGLRIYFIGYLFAGVNIPAASFLSAACHAIQALGVSLLRSCLLLIPMIFLLGSRFGLSGVWAAFPVTEAAVTILALRFLSRHFQFT